MDRHRPLLGPPPSAVQREVDRNAGRHAYRAAAAQGRAERLRPCRTAKLAADRDPAERIAVRLRKGLSPAGAARLEGGVCMSAAMGMGPP